MKDEITIIYKIEYNNRIKIFGYEFVKNNKDICRIKVNNNEMELNEYYEFESDLEREKHKQLEIKLI